MNALQKHSPKKAPRFRFAAYRLIVTASFSRRISAFYKKSTVINLKVDVLKKQLSLYGIFVREHTEFQSNRLPSTCTPSNINNLSLRLFNYPLLNTPAEVYRKSAYLPPYQPKEMFANVITTEKNCPRRRFAKSTIVKKTRPFSENGQPRKRIYVFILPRGARLRQ